MTGPETTHPVEPPRDIRSDPRCPVEEAGVPEWLLIDSTHLKAHRTAASLLKKGIDACVDLDASDGPKAA